MPNKERQSQSSEQKLPNSVIRMRTFLDSNINQKNRHLVPIALTYWMWLGRSEDSQLPPDLPGVAKMLGLSEGEVRDNLHYVFNHPQLEKQFLAAQEVFHQKEAEELRPKIKKMLEENSTPEEIAQTLSVDLATIKREKKKIGHSKFVAESRKKQSEQLS